MGRKWQIGDPVDYSTDGWMDAQNWNSGYYIIDDEPVNKNSKRDEYLEKARHHFYMKNNKKEALDYVNLALDLDNKHARSWELKAIILGSMKRYEESDKCYKRSLQLNQTDSVRDNRAKMLYEWAINLVQESKESYDPLKKLNEAEEKITTAINTLPDENNNKNIDKYLNLKDSISSSINMEKEYSNNFKTLREYDSSELFTITGNDFCDNHSCFTPGTPYRLVKEPNNEFDPDAIAVYFKDEKIGYVANSFPISHVLTSKASELWDKIPDNAEAEYLFTLKKPGKNFRIGKLI